MRWGQKFEEPKAKKSSGTESEDKFVQTEIGRWSLLFSPREIQSLLGISGGILGDPIDVGRH
jgi:hypothetical protein